MILTGKQTEQLEVLYTKCVCRSGFDPSVQQTLTLITYLLDLPGCDTKNNSIERDKTRQDKM